MASYADFKRKYLGQGFDLDRAFGCQCWDGYAWYCQYLGYPYAHCTSSGYVKDIWNNRRSNGTLNNFVEVNTMQPGDVAVFKEVPGITPWSHVAIFDSDAGSGWGWFLGQNQDPNNMAFTMCKLPYSATFDTAFRPKCFANNAQAGTNSNGTTNKIEWDPNAYLHVGDVVKSVSLPIQGVVGNCVRINELGGLVPLIDVTEASDSGDGNPSDDYLSNLNARVYLSETTVQSVDPGKNRVMVNGYWVNPGPLMAKR